MGTVRGRKKKITKASLILHLCLTEVQQRISTPRPLKPRRREDGHHRSRSANGAAFANGKTRQSRCCHFHVQIHFEFPHLHRYKESALHRIMQFLFMLYQSIWRETSHQCTIAPRVPRISRQIWMLRTINWQTDPVAADISVSSLPDASYTKNDAHSPRETYVAAGVSTSFTTQTCSHAAAGLTRQHHVRGN